jgi:hypothetical protein
MFAWQCLGIAFGLRAGQFHHPVPRRFSGNGIRRYLAEQIGCRRAAVNTMAFAGLLGFQNETITLVAIDVVVARIRTIDIESGYPTLENIIVPAIFFAGGIRFRHAEQKTELIDEFLMALVGFRGDGDLAQATSASIKEPSKAFPRLRAL